MTQAEIARQANVNPSDVSNYMHKRWGYISPEKRARIEAVVPKKRKGAKWLILEMLKRGERVDFWTVLKKIGSRSVEKRIHDLRRMGYDIETDETTKYASYKLKGAA